MAKRIRTTYTFGHSTSASVFKEWLKQNENDSDFGHPVFIDIRDTGTSRHECWTVEYEYDGNNQVARGFAHGCDSDAHATGCWC